MNTCVVNKLKESIDLDSEYFNGVRFKIIGNVDNKAVFSLSYHGTIKITKGTGNLVNASGNLLGDGKQYTSHNADGFILYISGSVLELLFTNKLGFYQISIEDSVRGLVICNEDRNVFKYLPNLHYYSLPYTTIPYPINVAEFGTLPKLTKLTYGGNGSLVYGELLDLIKVQIKNGRNSGSIIIFNGLSNGVTFNGEIIPNLFSNGALSWEVSGTSCTASYNNKSVSFSI